jgi:hypothetical protein
LLSAAFVVAVLLVVMLGQRKVRSTTPPLEDWTFSELVAYLNRAGLGLRPISTQKNGNSNEAVFLTTTDREWKDLNALSKDPRRIAEWRGILYCERLGGRDPSGLMSQWGEDCLVAGLFLFYGDRELLAQVRTVLSDFAPR